MKISCKMRREGWKAADRGADLPKGVNGEDMIDVIFWNDATALNRHANTWCWGWRGVTRGIGMTIRYWRFTPK